MPTIVARPSVGRVRVFYAIAALYALWTLFRLIVGEGVPVISLLLTLLLIAGAYTLGVARLWVHAGGVTRRDPLGRDEDMRWTDVRAVELRDMDWRRFIDTAGPMVLVGDDGRELAVHAYALPVESRRARRAAVQHAKAHGIDLVDRRTRPPART